MKTFIAILFILLSCIYAQAQTCADGQSPIWSATTGWTCGAITPGPLPSGSSLSMTIANAGVTGTTVNRLAKLTGAPSTAVITATTDTEGAIGVCTAGCGTTGSATIAIIGQVSCAFDGATTAGNYVTISATTAGMCHDAGSAFPTAQAAYGRVLSTNGGAGTYVMELMTPDIAFQNAGNGKSKPGGSDTQVQYNNSGVFAGHSSLVFTSAGTPQLVVPGGSTTAIGLGVGSTTQGFSNVPNGIGFLTGSTYTLLIHNGIQLKNNGSFSLTSSADPGGTVDITLQRETANRFMVCSVANCTTFGDLKVRQPYVDQTITGGGTTGNQTINKAAGTVNFAAAATALTVTNNLASTSSIVFAIARTNDATCAVKNVVPAAGSFVINMTAGCTAETSVGFLVVNK